MPFEATKLKGDGRTATCRMLDAIAKQSAIICENFRNVEVEFYDYDEITHGWKLDHPFAYNEVASASILASAATSLDYIALAEYNVQKKAKDRQKRTREGSTRNGRGDLWIGKNDRGSTHSWAFELKQSALSRNVTDISLSKKMEAASTDASFILDSEADSRIAGLIVSNYYARDLELCNHRCQEFTKNASVDFAWSIQIREDLPATFLFFNELQL